MQYRSDLIPRPLSMTHSPVGARLPRVAVQRVPFERNRRLISIERTAPKNGYEAISGLGVIDNTQVKARRIDGRFDRKMPYVGTTPIRNPSMVLSTLPIWNVRKGAAFRDVSLQGLGDGPVPGSNDAGFWNTLNTSLSSPQVNALVNAGANFYVQKETGKAAQTLAEAQIKTAALQAEMAKRNAAIAAANQNSGTPSWVIPAVTVGGLGLVALFFLRRK